MPPSNLRSILIALSIGNFLVSFMISGVGSILPSMGNALNASAAELSLVSAIYTLSLAVFNVVSAQLIVKIGQRRVFLVGFALFIGISGVLSLVPNIYAVFALRLFQGAGAAMVVTSSMTLLLTCAPPGMQGRMLGLMTAVTYVGIALGPLVGGGIATLWGWRWLFASIVPMGAPAWFITFRTVKVDWQPAPGRSLDWPGISLMGIAFSLITYGATSLGTSTFAHLLIIGGVVLFFVFLLVERHVKNPVVDVRFLGANVPLITGLLCTLVNFGATNGVLYYFILYLQQLRYLSPFEAGAFVALQSVTQSILSPISGRMSDRIPPEYVSGIGMALCAMGIWLAGFLHMETALWQVAAIQCIIGAGLAFFAGPNTLAIMRSVDAEHMPAASGLTGTVRTFGILTSLIIVSATMTQHLGTLGVSPVVANEFLTGMRFDMTLFALLNICGIFLGLFRVFWSFRTKRALQAATANLPPDSPEPPAPENTPK